MTCPASVNALSVALPIVSACGVEAVALPTVILSTHTGGFEGFAAREMTEEMRAFAAHWRSIGVIFDCIYTGFFGSVEQINLTEKLIHDFGGDDTVVIVDPVLGDNGRLYPCFSDEYVEAMRRLTALADVITPNLTEAAILAGLPFDTAPETILARLNVPNVIITGVRREGRIGYLSRFGGEKCEISTPYVPLALHGTGDVFASAFCGKLMADPQRDMQLALAAAADFCYGCVRETVKRQPSHWYGLSFEDMLKKGALR
ncbi:MAG: PfkB family carbohydrate kinase [Oscillospiraceae bacterium]